MLGLRSGSSASSSERASQGLFAMTVLFYVVDQQVTGDFIEAISSVIRLCLDKPCE
jgi:hypothetical protein